MVRLDAEKRSLTLEPLSPNLLPACFGPSCPPLNCCLWDWRRELASLVAASERKIERRLQTLMPVRLVLGRAALSTEEALRRAVVGMTNNFHVHRLLARRAREVQQVLESASGEDWLLRQQAEDQRSRTVQLTTSFVFAGLFCAVLVALLVS